MPARREPINAGLVVEYDDGEIRFRFRGVDEDGQPTNDLAWCRRPNGYLHAVAKWRRLLLDDPVDWRVFRAQGPLALFGLDPVALERKLWPSREEHFERLYRQLVLPRQ